jgi:hypothetical protein
MDGRVAIWAVVVSLLLIGSQPSQAQQAVGPAAAPAQPRLQEARRSGQVISPLHAFLGIDPVTGEFKPARQGSPAASVRPQGSAPNNPPELASGEPGTSAPLNGSEPSTDFQIDDKTLDDFRASISKALDEHDDGALAASIANLTRSMKYDRFSLLDPRIERIGYLALFLYPLGIVLSELYGVWSRRHTVGRLERERRFYARQRNRRFTLAAFSAATIGLFWWAGEHSFWWGEPRRLVAFIAGLTFLAAASALLRLIIARAAKEYVARTVEDLRMQQLALEKEIRELRSRLQGNGIEGTVATDTRP